MPSQTDLANAIRALSMDAVQKANSGHPGAPMGLADIAEVLWNRFLKHNPNNPNWVNRDRFVLSNGHGSMLLYSLLHLSGYDVSINDLKDFRQLHSKTPGHPEYGETPGVETTTGPLGQGIANAVGMAIAEKSLASQFNKESFDLINHFTYAIVGDGCLMEGISHEACSLAGTLKLNKLIVFYDSNQISIDGAVDGWFTDNTAQRFQSYGWNVIEDVDGHNPDQITKATEAAQSSDKPTLIICNTIIGFGSPNKSGKAKAHGAPLGEDEIKLVRETINWPHAAFEIPDNIRAQWDAKEKGQALESDWNQQFANYQEQHPELAQEFQRRTNGELPADWGQFTQNLLKNLDENTQAIATRKASLVCLNHFGPKLPEMLGGSADLTESNLTLWQNCSTISPEDHSGQYLYYGVREFGMSAIMNGIALYGGFLPYSGTFLTFSDYARNAVRMAALMKQRVVHVYTHDSVGLGEDGPTHQPVEHVTSLRLIPNLSLWRPADTTETAVAWKKAIEANDKPTCLVLSRQTLPPKTEHRHANIDDIEKGGYVYFEPKTEAKALIIATGSELPLAVDTALALENEGIAIRVVSMPSVDTFLSQDADYRNAVLPSSITARVAVEAGSTVFWHQFVGHEGIVIGIDEFGASAPGDVMFKHFGITQERVTESIRSLIK